MSIQYTTTQLLMDLQMCFFFLHTYHCQAKRGRLCKTRLTKKNGLTVSDASQGLVEGGCVAVVCERDTHSSRQKPSG